MFLWVKLRKVKSFKFCGLRLPVSPYSSRLFTTNTKRACMKDWCPRRSNSFPARLALQTFSHPSRLQKAGTNRYFAVFSFAIFFRAISLYLCAFPGSLTVRSLEHVVSSCQSRANFKLFDKLKGSVVSYSFFCIWLDFLQSVSLSKKHSKGVRWTFALVPFSFNNRHYLWTQMFGIKYSKDLKMWTASSLATDWLLSMNDTLFHQLDRVNFLSIKTLNSSVC